MKTQERLSSLGPTLGEHVLSLSEAAGILWISLSSWGLHTAAEVGRQQ